MLVGIILAAISWALLARSRWSLIGCAIDGCVGGIILGPVFYVIGLVSNGTIHYGLYLRSEERRVGDPSLSRELWDG